jgi:hypothetical protein
MVFIGVVIYIGVYLEANIASYWNTKPIAPTHILSSNISLYRYKQIKRYLHISCSITDINNGFHLPNNDRWWYKIEPLSSKLKHTKESLGGKRRYYSTDSRIHYRVKIPQKSYSWCLYIVQYKQIRGEEYKGSRVTRTRSACIFCKAPLYTEGDYWSNYYNIYDY